MNLLLLLPLFSAHLNASLDELIHTDGLVSSDGTQTITRTLITMFRSFVLCVCVRALRPHKIFKINTFKTCNILFKMILWQGNAFHITGHVTVIVKLDCHIKFIDRSTKGGARASSSIVTLQWYHINGLVQQSRNSSVLAMELRLSCTNPWPWASWCLKLPTSQKFVLQLIQFINKG